MPVVLSELDLALEYSSTDFSFGCYFVYVNRATGELHHDSEDAEEVLPEDVEDFKKYIQVPTKADLGLGKPLVIQFTSEKLPEQLKSVYEIFSRKGAYQRYKSLLSELDMLDAWYEYESVQQKKVLLVWCEENEIEVSI